MAGTQRRSKEVYQAVKRVIDGNTTPVQRPSMSLPALKTVLVPYGRFTSDEVRSATEALVENGEALAWRDREGKRRVCLVDYETLERLIEYESEQLDPNSELIAEANRLRQELRGDGDD